MYGASRALVSAPVARAARTTSQTNGAQGCHASSRIVARVTRAVRGPDACARDGAVTRAGGESLDWMNDDFVPAGKAKKNKKVPKAQTQKTPPAAREAPAPASASASANGAGDGALDWENDDFGPAGKAKKNKKVPKATEASAPEAEAEVEAPAEALDWENETFEKPVKSKKKAKKPAFVPPPAKVEAVVAPVVEATPEPAREVVDAEPEPEPEPAREPEPVAATPTPVAKATPPPPPSVVEPSKPEPVVAAAAVEEEAEDATAEAAEAPAPMFDENHEYIGPAIDWSEPDEVEVEDDGNPIPKYLRDIFAKDAKPSARRSSGSVTTGVRLENVRKTFKNMPILDGVNWDCKKGERVGLVGWNGAGKTTQLRIITGEMEADEGEIMLAQGVKIGYLTQEFEVKESNTVREEFMASYGDETEVMKNLERINKELENNPSMELVTLLIDKQTELQRQADRMDLFKMERAIDKIMPELGFVPEDNDRLVASFSGGWQMRISLGKILLQEPGLLLFDEPTNHLDLDTIQWLESYLKSLDVPMVIVSHDREFLDQLCTKTVEIERGIATTYKGNYSQYVAEKESNSSRQLVAYDKWVKEVARQRDMITRLAGGGQSGRATAAQKSLDKLLEEPVEKPWIAKRRRFFFPDCSRSSQVVAKVENVTHGYDEKTLFKNTSLQIERGERVAMIGDNGCGKSTLMRLIQGREKPISGIAEIGDSDMCKVNYFYQNQAEGLDRDKGVLQTLVEAAPDAQLNELKALLGQMAFSTPFHEKPVKFLSGGEKARLALAKFMVTPANVLLLDEPTNHLDIPSKEMLEHAIRSFQGTVIAISHDRYFLRQIATRVLAFDEGAITDYAGDYAYYLGKNDEAGARDAKLESKKNEIEKSQIVAKSKMSKAEKAAMKKEKAKSFSAGSGAAKKNKNAGRWA